MATVTIVERETGIAVGSFQIAVHYLGQINAQEADVDEAWKLAVQDKVVNPSQRDDYDFLISE